MADTRVRFNAFHKSHVLQMYFNTPNFWANVHTGFKEKNVSTHMPNRVPSRESAEIRTRWVNLKKKKAKRGGLTLTRDTGTQYLILCFLCWQPHWGLKAKSTRTCSHITDRHIGAQLWTLCPDLKKSYTQLAERHRESSG